MYIVALFIGLGVLVFSAVMIRVKKQQTAPRPDYPYGRYNNHTGTAGLSLEGQKRIEDKIDCLRSKLNMPPFKEYRFDAAFLNELRDYVMNPSKDDAVINKLVAKILSHIGMSKLWVDVNVVFDNAVGHNGTSAAGMYSENGFVCGRINIIIGPQYDAERIIAVACHECAHHFLYKKRVKLDDINENERLTDIAAVYMGFGSYMKRAYEVKYVNAYQSSKLGYLNSCDLDYAHVIVKRLQFEEEIRMEIIAEAKAEARSRIAGLKAVIKKNETAIAAIDRYSTAYNAVGCLKLVNENYALVQNGEMHKWGSELAERLDSSRVTMDDLKLLQNDLEEYRSKLNEYDKAAYMYSQLSQFQSNLSGEALSSLQALHDDAMRNDADSLFMLIKYYLSVPGFSDDAAFYFEKLCKCQNAEGYCRMGDCYSSGIMVAQNTGTADYYYYNAMQMGSLNAREKFEGSCSSHSTADKRDGNAKMTYPAVA